MTSEEGEVSGAGHEAFAACNGARAEVAPLLPDASSFVAAHITTVTHFLRRLRLTNFAAAGRVGGDVSIALPLSCAVLAVAPIAPVAPDAIHCVTLLGALLDLTRVELFESPLADLAAVRGLLRDRSRSLLLPAAALRIASGPVCPGVEGTVDRLCTTAVGTVFVTRCKIMDRPFAEAAVAAAVVLDPARSALEPRAGGRARAPVRPVVELTIEGGVALNVRVAAALFRLRAQGRMPAGRGILHHLPGAARDATGAAGRAVAPVAPVAPLAVFAASRAMLVDARLYSFRGERLAGDPALFRVLCNVALARPEAEATCGRTAAPF
mmetsp:Transcript_67642/g.161384  ORF Transcript_67642/g.161384 Transcript_67642/m.161384 type:complete len:324 (+) Transcript_67642:677-1648(+)